MYYIIVYDVNQTRVSQILKALKKYMFWVQNSVFEGELSEGQFARLQSELSNFLNLDEDSVIIYRLDSRLLSRTVLGKMKGSMDTMI